MKNRNPKSDKRKMDSDDESSDEDGSANEWNSHPVVTTEDNDEADSHKASSESEEGSSSDSNSEFQFKAKKRKLMRSNELLSDSADSYDETCEKCAICLRSILSQEVGSPEGCDHLFCSVCIIEWSKNSNVCPLDRQQFSIILVRKSKNGKVVKQLSVEEPKPLNIYDEEEEDDTYCEVCGESDREERMLLCDGCQRGFHIECLTPPLEEVPLEDEWFCPNCRVNSSLDDTNNILDNIDEELNQLVRQQRVRGSLRRSGSSGRSRTGTRIRTRLLERIRVAVNRIVRSCFLDADEDDDDEDEEEDEEDDDFQVYDSELEESVSEESVTSENQPGTSGTQSKTKKAPTSTKKRKTKKRKRSTKKIKTKRKTKNWSNKKRKTDTKRKAKRKSSVRTKRMKVQNADGSGKVTKTRTYKRRRRQNVKKKVKTAASRRSSGNAGTPKTVKGRLALTLGMVPPKRPGQLLPDVKIRSRRSELSGIDINRARAGIPRLHIFEPRHELHFFSSGSDGEGFAADESGPVATLAQPRITLSSIRDRKRAALLFQSTPTVSIKPKPVTKDMQDTSNEFDILSSILDSQAIWHSKNTDVKIREDGSIEVLKKTDIIDKKSSADEKKGTDTKVITPEGITTQAPMYPGSSSRPGTFRQYNRNSFGDSRGSQDNSLPARSSVNQPGVGFNRFGSAPRNDREGYANYLNNMPQGPIPFCRGGPPLRFRMPSRQQLRRFPFPPRINRSPWQNTEDAESASKNSSTESKPENNAVESKKTEEEDVDLYSDIETNADKADSPEREEGASSYPALGPPPEPSAFLLGIDENGEVAEKKNTSDVYDPAEPCDSEDEMVIDETVEKPSSPAEEKGSEQGMSPTNHKPPPSPIAKSPKESRQRGSTEDEDDECPIFSIYSSTSREFSQKEEEEREREIAQGKGKLEEIERDIEKNSLVLTGISEAAKPDHDNELSERKETNVGSEVEAETREPTGMRSMSKERVGNRLSFDMEKGDDKCPSQDDEESIGSRSCPSQKNASRSRSGTPVKNLSDSEHSVKSHLDRSHSAESEKARGKSSSLDRSTEKTSRRRSKSGDSDSDTDSKKRRSDDDDEDDRNTIRGSRKVEQNIESESESVQTKIATGLEGLDVEEVSSDNGDGDDFIERRSLSSFSLSELSNRSQDSMSRLASRKKKKRKRRKGLRKNTKKYDDTGDGRDDGKEKIKSSGGSAEKVEHEDIENEGQVDKHRRRKSNSAESDRQILGNKENKKDKSKEKDKDLSWKKPSKKEKNYREGKKRSKERGRSKSKDRRKSRTVSPKKDKKKNKDRKKKSEKKKEIERYDVRKVVKNKEIRKTDAFGRDIISKSRSISRSRSRSPIRERSRNMLRRDSRSYSRSRSRSYRRGRSPIRRRYLRSRTKSRSKSLRRSFSRSRSRSRSIRKNKKKFKSKERLKGRSRSRGRKSRSRRRSLSRSRSRSPIPRMQRGKRPRSRRSWSHHSRSLSFSPRRSRSFSRSPVRLRRSYTRSMSSSWSRGRSPIPRAASLEKLTVVLKTKDKKKGKKKKDGKRGKRDEERRKKIGNSKEVFASGDNVLVSVNFRNNNNNASSNNNNGSVTNETGRNARLDSSSPAPNSDRKKRRGSEYEVERVSKKSKKSSTISKNVVDMALSNSCSKRAKKLTRLSEKDAEVILNRKPVAVIDLDLSPYREQTPSPINVVVVSDSGSGDEGKEPSPQRQNVRGSPGSEAEKNKEVAENQSANVSVPNSPVANGYLTGPKTPPEPQIKFSIAKPQQLRQIANPLGDDDDDEEDAEEDEEQEFKRIESLDRRIEKELDTAHKGPNTPPGPRGPTTPKTPPSPQTSPDAYDPFEPTKSRSPTPSQDKENRKSPLPDPKDDQATVPEIPVVAPSVVNEMEPTIDAVSESQEEKPATEVVEKGEAIPVLETAAPVLASVQPCTPLPETRKEESPERKISVVITGQQNKIQPPATSQKPYTPVLKPLCMAQGSNVSTPPVSGSLTMSFSSFSLPSPTRTTRPGGVTASQPVQLSGIQRLQHRLGSPVNRTPNSVKSTPEKRSTPRTEPNDIPPAGTYRAGSKRNGEQVKQARPLQDTTNETIDMTVDMDDSPYSPASSEGDDLFDPPTEPTKPAQTNPKLVQPGYKPPQGKGPHKSPMKQLSKFDLLFGPSGPTLSPVKVANKKPKTNSKPGAQPKPQSAKPAKKSSNSKRGVSLKMDEDQLRILDELPSSAVELHVKDKFLKKLNRQERVVDEVKTVLKPHYARKHITKEEYKDILRRSVPKICHSRSGEINPSKIQSLIEAYVKKFRHAKKKGASSNAAIKPKAK